MRWSAWPTSGCAARPTPIAHHSSGSDLALFPDEKFDFVYSYAVFQHIPSREVVFQYLREARRVLKTGGILRCQINGLPAHARQYDTWSGVRIAPAEVARFARENDFQLLALEQIWTQYMWITCRKMPAGWVRSLPGKAPGLSARSAPSATRSRASGPRRPPGRWRSSRVWIDRLPEDCDLNHTAITADGRRCRLTYIGEPEPDGVSQVNAALPEGLRTGLVPIELTWLGRPVCPPGWMRIVPAGPSVPRISALTDGVNLLSGNRISSGILKVTMHEVTQRRAIPHRGGRPRSDGLRLVLCRSGRPAVGIQCRSARGHRERPARGADRDGQTGSSRRWPSR